MRLCVWPNFIIYKHYRNKRWEDIRKAYVIPINWMNWYAGLVVGGQLNNWILKAEFAKMKKKTRIWNEMNGFSNFSEAKSILITQLLSSYLILAFLPI